MARRLGPAIVLLATALLLAGGAGGASRAAGPRAGGLIAFTSGRDGNAEIYLMAADGSGQRRLTRNPPANFAPAWSPDGRRIAFTSFRDGNAEIYVMAADGSGQRNLTRNKADDGSPAWSPAPGRRR